MKVDKAIEKSFQEEDKNLELTDMEYNLLLESINKKIDIKENSFNNTSAQNKSKLKSIKLPFVFSEFIAVAVFILILVLVPNIKSFLHKTSNLPVTKTPPNQTTAQATPSPQTNLIVYKDTKRFVEKELKLLKEPSEESNTVRIIDVNTVVTVYGTIKDKKDILWLYIEVPVYDSPIHSFGWIQERDTTAFTKEKENLVQSDVFVNEGTPVYEVFEFEKLSSTTPYNCRNKLRGRLVKKEQGYALLSCPGGMNIWVQEKYLIYEKPNENTTNGTASQTPQQKIESFFDYFFHKDINKMTYMHSLRHMTSSRAPNPIAYSDNLKSLKLISIELDPSKKNEYLIEGPYYSEERVMAYKVIYDVKYQTPPKGTVDNNLIDKNSYFNKLPKKDGVYTAWFFFYRENSGSWAIDDNTVPTLTTSKP